MGVSPWIAEHWFELIQTIGIICGLLFTAYTTRKEERARKIGNLVAIKQQYREIWKELYGRPKLSRVLQRDVDLAKKPISDEEGLFVKLLILHLDTVHRAMKARMFVKLEGLQTDVKEFFASPIPRAVWERMKPLQDAGFVRFVESCLAES